MQFSTATRLGLFAIGVLAASVTAQAQPSPANKFDGHYVGATQSLAGGRDARGCVGNPSKQIVVKDGSFIWYSQSTSTKQNYADNFTISPSGSFTGRAQTGEMTGSFSGDEMTAKWTVSSCVFDVKLHKTGG